MILRRNVRVPDHDVVLFAGLDDLAHCVEHFRMFVLTRKTQFLAQVAFANQNQADAGHVREDVVEVLDRLRAFAHQANENFTVRRERPDVGLLIVLRHRQAPITRSIGRSVAAHALRFIDRRMLRTRIAARRHRVIRLFDRGHVRPDHAVRAAIEHLLGEALVHLRAVRRNARDGRHARRDRAGFGNLLAAQHVLQRVAECRNVVRVVLHFEHDAVVGRIAHLDGALLVELRECGERGLAGFERADNAVDAGIAHRVASLLANDALFFGFPIHEAHAFAGAGGRAPARDVIDERHFRAGFFERFHHAHIELDFRGAGLIRAIVHGGEAFVVVIRQHLHDAMIELFIVDEMREAARGEDAHAHIGGPRRDRFAQHAAEFDATRHRGLRRRIEAVHDDRYMRRRIVVHDLVIDEAVRVRRNRVLGQRLHPDVVGPREQVGEIEAFRLEAVDQIRGQFRMARVRDMPVGRVDGALRRAVVNFGTAIDRDGRGEVGEDFLLVLAENNRHVDLRFAIRSGHLVERHAAARRARGAFFQREERRECRFAMGFQFGIGPRPVAEPQFRIIAVALAVLEPVFRRLAKHAAMRYGHPEYDFRHMSCFQCSISRHGQGRGQNVGGSKCCGIDSESVAYASRNSGCGSFAFGAQSGR
ncbi:hypothetical protein PT2222_20268 [Paraburkholderia tropica]